MNEADSFGINTLQYATLIKPNLSLSPFDPSRQLPFILNIIDQYGGDVGGLDGCYESSLLYFAVCAKNIALVEVLLARGMDPNLQALFCLSLPCFIK